MMVLGFVAWRQQALCGFYSPLSPIWKAVLYTRKSDQNPGKNPKSGPVIDWAFCQKRWYRQPCQRILCYYCAWISSLKDACRPTTWFLLWWPIGKNPTTLGYYQQRHFTELPIKRCKSCKWYLRHVKLLLCGELTWYEIFWAFGLCKYRVFTC